VPYYLKLPRDLLRRNQPLKYRSIVEWGTLQSFAALSRVDFRGGVKFVEGCRMSFDVVLIVVVLAGIALSAAYVRAEYTGWRADRAAERRRESALSELHAARLSSNATLLPSVVQLRGFSPQDRANTLEAANTGSQPSYPSVERRKQPRQHATQ